MVIRFKILLFALSFPFFGLTQRYLVPIQLSEEIESKYYLDSVYIHRDDPHVLGYSKSGLFKRKIRFDDCIQAVVSDYFSKSFTYDQNKKGLNIIIDYIQVNSDNENEIFLTLTFIEKRNANFFHLLTIGSYVSGLSHYEVLLSKAIQECFDSFLEFQQEEKMLSISEEDIIKKKTNFPILKAIHSDNLLQAGKYKTLGDFQQNSIEKYDKLKMISINDGLNGYLVKIDGKKETNAIAICHENEFYYRMGKRYFKTDFSDTTITILANDQRDVMDSRLVGFYFGIASGLTAIAIEQPGFFLPGLIVGGFMGHAVTGVIVKKRMNKKVKYKLNISNGKIQRLKG